MFRDEFDPGGVVERMKIIIIDFFFLSLSLTFAVWKEKTGQESARERERRKEGRKERENYLMCIPLHFPSHYLPTLGYSGYFTLLRFALLYFTFCLVECSKALNTYLGTYLVHVLICTSYCPLSYVLYI